MKTLIIGYGNTLRTDDGLGVYAAQALASAPLPGEVEVIACQQLYPELCAALAQVDQAVFIDAALAGEGVLPGEIEIRPLQPRPVQPGSLTHHFDPEALLAMSQALYGRAPRAVLFNMTAGSFELGESLTPKVARALPDLVEQVSSCVNVE